MEFETLEQIRKRLLVADLLRALKIALVVGPMTSVLTGIVQPAHISLIENILAGLCIGTVLSMLYLSLNLVISDYLRRKRIPFGVGVLATLGLLVMANLIVMIPFGLLFFPDEVFQLHMLSFGFLTAAFFAILVSGFNTLAQFASLSVVKSVYKGTYFYPRKERNIFLFVDVKSSSTIAEQINSEQYFGVINEFHINLETFVRYYRGTIYKYLGDGQIIVWPPNLAEQAMKMVLHFMDDFSKVQNQVSEKYKVDLQFTAGLHYGDVTVSEIGHDHKEIGFWGDAVNTTQRIQEACKFCHAPFLMSEAFLNLVSSETRSRLLIEELNDIQLRGKKTKVNLRKFAA